MNPSPVAQRVEEFRVLVDSVPEQIRVLDSGTRACLWMCFPAALLRLRCLRRRHRLPMPIETDAP